MNQQLRLREISVSGAWVIARREIRDQLRDWRTHTLLAHDRGLFPHFHLTRDRP
jgi:hypothetical protein